MNNNEILEGLTKALEGIEEIKRSNKRIQEDVAENKEEIKSINDSLSELKLDLGKLSTKVDGIDTRLGNEETISRNALGVVAGGTMLAVAKYLFFPS